jgi:hypothetical protein
MGSVGKPGMIRPEYELYREAKLKSGASYQDFIMVRLHLLGWVLQPYCSREGQLKGENLFGLEIKNDDRMSETGNVCIEVAEKARPRVGDYVPSGIFRKDNTWMYGIGNRLLFLVFAKSTLKTAYARRVALRFKNYETQTSRGFLIPLSDAEKMCAQKILFDLSGNIKERIVGGDVTEIDLTDSQRPGEFQLPLL